MKKNKLRIEKITVTKLSNLHFIKGGNPGDTDGDGTETRNGAENVPPPPPPCEGILSFFRGLF